jgi:NAD(P) transhydrogenase
VQIFTGSARFLDPHTVAILGSGERRLTAERIVIATGTRPAHPPEVAFDERSILDSDGLLLLNRIPHSAVVVGGGVVGIEYASTFVSGVPARVPMCSRQRSRPSATRVSS